MMTVMGDENGDDSVSVSTYSQKQMSIKIQANWPLGWFSEQLLKNQFSQIAALGYGLTVLSPKAG